MHTNNVVSDNLPIYFIWFGSDIPPKYFCNLLRAAETNKSRDIILVYSEKHLPQNNRKNIDRIENIKINEIKERVEFQRNSETQNLLKIDMYNMELNKQDERVYHLLNKIFLMGSVRIEGKKFKSFKYCIASDIIRLSLLNITGGIYLDMDTEIIGEVGKIETKNGFGFHYYYDNDDSLELTGDFLIKVNKKDGYFYNLIEQYFNIIENFVANKPNSKIRTDPTMYLSNEILGYYLRKYIYPQVPAIMQGRRCRFRFHYDKKSKVIQYTFTTNDDNSHVFSFSFKGKDEICLSCIEDQSIFNYGIHVPQAIKLKMEQGEGYNIDYNNLKDLKKLGLDKCANINSELENLSLEQSGSSKEKRR